MEHYCGFDQGTKSISICIIKSDGKVVFETETPFEKRALRKHLSKYRSMRCVVEAGPLAEALSLMIEELGHRIDIIEARRAASVFKTKRKTDKLDARKLAMLARSGWYTKVHRKSSEARALRTYLTARMQLVKAAGGIAASIRGLLKANGLVLGKGNFEEQVLLTLERCDSLVKQALLPMLEAFKLLEKQEKMLYRNLERKVVKRKPEIARLTSIHSVGPATAAAFVSTIDDPKRFKDAEQVTSYIGLVPSVYQSGETEVRGRITKDGDELLRWLLVESATVLLSRCQKKSALRDWGLKLQEKKGFGKARVAVARKLAQLMYTLWIRKEHFEPRNVELAA